MSEIIVDIDRRGGVSRVDIGTTKVNVGVVVDQRPIPQQTVVIPPHPNAIQGPPGPIGPRGIQGPIGPKGDKGDPGTAPTRITVSLTSDHIAQKMVLLEHNPVGGIIILHPHGGPPQRQGIDYEYANGALVWNGLGLEGFLEEGESLDLFYFH